MAERRHRSELSPRWLTLGEAAQWLAHLGKTSAEILQVISSLADPPRWPLQARQSRHA